MGLLKLIFSKQERDYLDYKIARDKRARNKARYDAERPTNRFQAVIKLADGTVFECEHAHRSRSAAKACGERAAAGYQHGS